MVKIKGKDYKRVAAKKSGGCPKGARRFKRGKSKSSGCYEPVKAKKRKRGKR